jgi:YARHG domain
MLNAPKLLCVTVLLSIALIPIVGSAQERLQEWENFDFRTTSIKRAQISGLQLYELKLLRGLIFGRHGRVFKDAEIRLYLQDRQWYKPDPNFQNSSLNKTERQSLDLVREAEASKHETVQPGDMRYWRTRLLNTKKLGTHSGAEWKILSAEVEAIHGKKFEDEPWLQQYFDERYWYSAGDKYDPKQLSQIERKNLQLIFAAEKKQRNVAVAPGDMELFENRLLTAEMLRGLSLYELRLLRNEVYARHGRSFRSEWLSQYFFSQPWYAPDENFKDEQLSGSDKQNVETIVGYENQLHEELSAKPITRALLAGLFVEDAAKMRQEIYARRGKIFKEPWLQQYFASFDWYKADPNFVESSLTAVEKQNIATIAAYEKKAVSEMSVIEG